MVSFAVPFLHRLQLKPTLVGLAGVLAAQPLQSLFGLPFHDFGGEGDGGGAKLDHFLGLLGQANQTGHPRKQPGPVLNHPQLPYTTMSIP